MLLTDAEIARVAHEAARVTQADPDLSWENIPEGARVLSVGMTRSLRAQPGATLCHLYPSHGTAVGRRVFTAVVRALDA